MAEATESEAANAQEQWKEELVRDAQLAMDAERFGDMLKAIRQVAEASGPSTFSLDENQRNLLSFAYKAVVKSVRKTYETLGSALQRNELNEEGLDEGTHEKIRECTKEYMDSTREEVKEHCNFIINLLESKLIPSATRDEDDPSKEDIESQAFYWKMKGDSYRYLAEVEKYNEILCFKADEAYSKASAVAEKGLVSMHPIRLGVVINHSVFCYDVMKQHKKARDMAEKAYEEVYFKDKWYKSDKTDEVVDDLLRVIRENLTMWEAERKANQFEED